MAMFDINPPRSLIMGTQCPTKMEQSCPYAIALIDTVIIYGHSVGVLSSSAKIPRSYFSKDADTMGILLVQTPCHGTIHGLTSGSWYTKRSIIGRVYYILLFGTNLCITSKLHF